MGDVITPIECYTDAVTTVLPPFPVDTMTRLPLLLFLLPPRPLGAPFSASPTRPSSSSSSLSSSSSNRDCNSTAYTSLTHEKTRTAVWLRGRTNVNRFMSLLDINTVVRDKFERWIEQIGDFCAPLHEISIYQNHKTRM